MDLLPFEAALKGRRIFVTGTTGFTGGWASLWLDIIGAHLAGFSLRPETTPNLFDALALKTVPTAFGDITDVASLERAVDQFQPELILHLAAQPLVRRSYREPLRTFEVNTQGTGNVLEAARRCKSVRGVLCITTDKVYRNHEWSWPYRENDELGGKDPYSASKSAAEIVIQSYAASFSGAKGEGPWIATARGGNIIGGGDWSEDRLIPDFIRSVVNNETLTLRYPDATRPWQHVMALVHGYLILLAGLVSDEPARFARAWNLGPLDPRQFSVRDVLELMSLHWQRPAIDYMNNPVHEAGALALDSSNARNLLGWIPPWGTEQVIEETAKWYRSYYADPGSAAAISRDQINAWRAALR
jgi:CDP-glucose 4,6-dehydratase